MYAMPSGSIYEDKTRSSRACETRQNKAAPALLSSATRHANFCNAWAGEGVRSDLSRESGGKIRLSFTTHSGLNEAKLPLCASDVYTFSQRFFREFPPKIYSLSRNFEGKTHTHTNTIFIFTLKSYQEVPGNFLGKFRSHDRHLTFRGTFAQ